jgi:hypothetical protein
MEWNHMTGRLQEETKAKTLRSTNEGIPVEASEGLHGVQEVLQGGDRGK